MKWKSQSKNKNSVRLEAWLCDRAHGRPWVPFIVPNVKTHKTLVRK